MRACLGRRLARLLRREIMRWVRREFEDGANTLEVSVADGDILGTEEWQDSADLRSVAYKYRFRIFDVRTGDTAAEGTAKTLVWIDGRKCKDGSDLARVLSTDIDSPYQLYGQLSSFFAKLSERKVF